MTDERPDGAANGQRRTLSEADISSRRSSPRGLLVNLLGASGASASASVRASAPRADHDGVPSPAGNDTAAKPDQD